MKNLKTFGHLLSGDSLPNLIAVLYRNRSGISLKYLPQILLIILTPLFLFPFYLCERLFYTGRIRRTRITKDPVFIIGHFRSGTTYLHNLLCLDKQFGFPTTFQCFLPGVFLAGKGFARAILRMNLPGKRPMDDVRVDPGFPQEEEYIISGLSPLSYYQCYFFPKKMREFFSNYSLLDNGYSARWEKLFLFIVKKITFAWKGKQLIMKNPVNTTRIRQLVRMFPEAKFIYLHRDPWTVLPSTFKLLDKLLEIFSFQEIDEHELRENVRWVYSQTIARYAVQRKLIPGGNLAEVSYEDLVRDPLNELERIYRELQLDGFMLAKGEFESYIAEQSTYIPDVYSR